MAYFHNCSTGHRECTITAKSEQNKFVLNSILVGINKISEVLSGIGIIYCKYNKLIG